MAALMESSRLYLVQVVCMYIVLYILHGIQYKYSAFNAHYPLLS